MATPALNTAFARLLPPAWPQPVVRTVSRLLGLDQLAATYDAVQAMDAREPLPARLLKHLRISYRVSEADLDRVPLQGPALVVANHPTGMLEAAVLAAVLRRRRGDVRFLANDLLSAIPELQPLIIPLDTLGGAPGVNRSGLRRALDHLARGGLLVIFPAGAVSHYQWSQREVTDPVWQPAAVRLIAICQRRGIQVPTIPIHVKAANSTAFHAAGFVHPRLRTALLVRELLNKRAATVELRIGKPVPPERLQALEHDAARIEYLRWRTYLLAQRNPFKQQTSKPLRSRFERRPEPIAEPTSAELLARDVAKLSPIVEGSGLAVFLARATEIPHVLQEIGRLRETTFRAAGEGTGKATDLDHFDATYLHLFLWNPATREIVGAYRLGQADAPQSLYTATLFEYGPDFLARLGPALELGRSFVRAEYQRSFAPLLLLWKGIGHYVARNPQYKTLFGPVSISNRYEAASRDLMISFLEKREVLHDWASVIRPRNPPTPQHWTENCRDLDELSDVVTDIETDAPGVPVLLRHYLKLGGKLLGFNVDREFAGALDGLIVVDLTRTDPRLLSRYLGKAEAGAFLAYQEGNHGNANSSRLSSFAHT